MTAKLKDGFMKWTILQIMIDLGFFAFGLITWAKLSKPQKDDPRMSRGLQLLQSKIAILEDLSDRVDAQVKQVATLLEQKSREVQQSIQAAQDQISRVDHSIQKSLDVSKIFQDKIPHKEIIERQNTIKYVQAARLAHQGLSAEEIAQKVDIPKSELDFIVKVNRNKLMFSEEHLPEWAQEPAEPEIAQRDLSQVFESFKVKTEKDESLQKIEKAFKEAIEEVKASQTPSRFETAIDSALENVTTKVENSVTNMANHVTNSIKESVKTVRPFIFKKYDESEPEKNMKI